MYKCACCFSDVTSPHFFNGAVYGYSCIKRVNPKYKKPKEIGLLVKADEISVEKRIAVINGIEFNIGFLFKPMADYEKCGYIKIAEYSNGTKPIYKESKVKIINGANDYENPFVGSVFIGGIEIDKSKLIGKLKGVKND